VLDPTGAGDSFAGGFMGYIAAQGDGPLDDGAAAPRDGLRHRVASFNVEDFGTERVSG
jgi:sugar/nucleoside kinase (ribokinase family)